MASSRVSRRSFLSVVGAAGGALLIGVEVAAAPVSRAAESVPATSLTVYVRVARDNTVTVIHPASEMGQGVLSSLTQLVAEELRLDWSAVRVQQGGNDARLGNPAFGGAQLTAGSRSIRGYYLPLRRAGAEARERLVAAAAARWSVEPRSCAADGGVVTGPGGRSATYGDLAEAAAAVA